MKVARPHCNVFRDAHKIELSFCVGHGTIDALFGFISLADLHTEAGADGTVNPAGFVTPVVLGDKFVGFEK